MGLGLRMQRCHAVTHTLAHNLPLPRLLMLQHYIPTLLGGVHGLGHQLQCNSGKDGPLNVPGGVSATDWSESLYEGHPKEYM